MFSASSGSGTKPRSGRQGRGTTPTPSSPAFIWWLKYQGTGTAIAANKVPGVRAALAWDPWIARGARLWNDANVLAMSLKRLAPDVAVEVTEAFLAVDTPDPDEAENIAALDRLLPP